MTEETWQFQSFAQMQGVSRRVDKPKRVMLLLHGLGERGKRIYRKLLPSLPEDALILAPNAPFPIHRKKHTKIDFGHSWYFYDSFEDKYFINQDLAKFWLRDLVKRENPNQLPVTIIGFSQGGYLAPLAGQEIQETSLIIGIGCEFKRNLIKDKLTFKMLSLHGELDQIIPIQSAINELENLKKIGFETKLYPIKDAGHEITHEMTKLIKKLLEDYGN